MEPGALHLSAEAFDSLLADILDELPEEWSPVLDNMAVVVEDEPDPSDSPDPAVFAVHRGSPVARQTLGGLGGPVLMAPPEVVLFHGPLERASASIDELRARMRSTLVAEIGRLFGLDADLDAEDEIFPDEMELDGIDFDE